MRIIAFKVPSQEALERSERRDLHRNPEAYRAFKASVAATFDISYFKRNRTSVDAVIRL